MKKTIIIIAAAAMAFAALSCSRNEMEISSASSAAGTVELSVTGSVPITKTSFGDPSDGVYPVLWSETGESVRLYERVDGASWSDKNTSVAYTPGSDLKSASFKFNIVPQVASRFDYYVVYPANGLTYQIKNTDAQDKWLNTVRLGTAGVQVPRPGNVDSRFTYLIGRQEGLSKQPSSIDVTFSHLLAYGKMTVRNFVLPSTDTLSAIRVNFNDKTHVTGFIDYRIEEDTPELTRANASKQYIEINPKNLTVSSDGFDVWFAIAPMTIEGGESITFSMTTKAGDVSKTVFLPEGKPMEFKRGRVLEFEVDMTGTSIPKKLQFDFTKNGGTLPTAAKTPNGMREWFSFTKEDKLEGGNYVFYNAGGCYHSDASDRVYSTLYDGAATGFLGLPAVPGYRLSRISVDRTGGTGANLYLEVLDDVATKHAITEKIHFPKGVASPPSIVLTGTKDNTVYWIHSLDNTYVTIGTLSLEYEAADASAAHPADYDVFLLLGQSNMAGRGEYEKTDCAPIPNVYLFTDPDKTAVYAAQPLLNMQSTIRKGYAMQKFNLGGPFGTKVNAGTGRKVLLVVQARGGVPIESWLSDAPATYFTEADGDEPYLWGQQMPYFFYEAVRRAKAARSYGTLRAVLWHQGEGNSSAEKAPLYLDKIQRFASELREALGMSAAELPFIVGELNYALDGAANLNPYLNQISTVVPNSACVSADGCESKSDNTHFTKEGLTLLGQRYAEKYLQMAN